MKSVFLSAMSGVALVLPAFALAQTQDQAPADTERVNMVIIYGDDACPPSSENEITVCARKDESERYRIPENLRLSDDPENNAWTNRVDAYETVGAFGTMSCSPTGAGGFTGCTQALIDAAYGEKRTSQDVQFSALIEEERQRRLSTIDEAAAAEQARVEQIEKEYMDRLERERAQSIPGEGALPAPDGAAPVQPSDAPLVMSADTGSETGPE